MYFLTTIAAMAASASAAAHSSLVSGDVPSAIYTMSNSAKGNVILAIPVNTKTGLIDQTKPIRSYSTYGNGTRFLASAGTKTPQDALFSQGSLIQAGARILAVNAGSNTLQEYGVNCSDPTNLINIGGSIPVNGQNPSAVAVDDENLIACVATTGRNSGIECYVEYTGLQYFSNTNVSLPLPVPQTGALPIGLPDTVSQLFFSDDHQSLIVIVKGAQNSKGAYSGGYIASYPISQHGLGTPVFSYPTGSSLISGCSQVYNSNNLLCADAAGGAILFSYANGKYTVKSRTPAAQFGSGTNRWAMRSPSTTGPIYITAVDRNYIAAFNTTTGHLIGGPYSQHNFTTGNPNLGEMAVTGSLIYALSYGNATHPPHITVAQDPAMNGTLKLLQNYAIPGVSNNVSGLAVFNPNDGLNSCGL